MFTTPRAGALRRMSLEELIGKLAQIEEHASLALTEHPRGQVLPRMRLILGIARQLRLHLEDQRDGGERLPVVASAKEAAGLQP
jgi:hypothetical protein